MDAATVNEPPLTGMPGAGATSYPQAFVAAAGLGAFTVETGVISGGTFTPEDTSFYITISC